MLLPILLISKLKYTKKYIQKNIYKKIQKIIQKIIHIFLLHHVIFVYVQ